MAVTSDRLISRPDFFIRSMVVATEVACTGPVGAGPESQVLPMLVSPNDLLRWRIQLSPCTAVTEMSPVPVD